MTTVRNDLTRTLLAVLFIGGLIAACLWILQPFLAAFIWATMIAVATWPLLLGAQRRLWGRRSLAVLAMTLALLLVFVVPFSLAVAAIADHADRIVGWTRSLATLKIPPPPAWVHSLPVVGAKAASVWQDIAVAGPEELARRVAPYAAQVAGWFVAQVGSFGLLLVQFLLTVIIAAILYAGGEGAALGVSRFARRLAGERGEQVMHLAGQAIRGVALGIVVTALIQAVLAGLGLAVAGVPLAAVLTVLMFILAIAQIGVVPVLLGAVGWLYLNDETSWAAALLVWTVIVGSLDNVIRPILIKKGADLPLLLIFAGVIGGLIAFGLVGIFVGPVLLAVSYTLVEAWVADQEAEEETAGEEPEAGLPGD
jgi:predicted PurR-regulated permease PerM